MEDLKFDPKNENIDLALEFFNKNANKFSGHKSGSECKFDGWNDIFYTDSCFDSLHSGYNMSESENDYLKFNQLARLIEENAELFAQIEFAIRKRSIKDVKKYDIPLITGYLRVLASGYRLRCKFDYCIPGLSTMHGNAPLANLGLFAEVSPIPCTINTAAVSILFSELCRQAGLTKPKVFIRLESLELKSNPKLDAASSCLGVITGSSDVDSAVDVFLRSTTKYPWKLSRILIEESIYDCFKSALSWKCRGNHETTEVNSFCADVFKYGDKIFMCDYAGVQNENGIYVEAYRTTKELLNLLAKYNQTYLSLWCNNISEANEISYSDSAPFVVWINDYGLFGPPKASLPYYEMFFSQTVSHFIEERFAKKIDAWRNKSPSDRRENIFLKLDKLIAKTNDDGLKSIRKELYFDNNSVTVANNKLCTCKGVSQDTDTIKLFKANCECLVISLKLLIDGCSFIYYDTGLDNNHLIDLEFSEDLPMILIEETNTHKDISMTFKYLPFRTKVVWSSYGTIFAN